MFTKRSLWNFIYQIWCFKGSKSSKKTGPHLSRPSIFPHIYSTKKCPFHQDRGQIGRHILVEWCLMCRWGGNEVHFRQQPQKIAHMCLTTGWFLMLKHQSPPPHPRPWGPWININECLQKSGWMRTQSTQKIENQRNVWGPQNNKKKTGQAT